MPSPCKADPVVAFPRADASYRACRADAVSAHPVKGEALEALLRRAAAWARRGVPHTAAELLSGTEGRLQFRPDHGDLRGLLPGGEDVRVTVCARNHRVVITRSEGTFRFTASADLPSYLAGSA